MLVAAVCAAGLFTGAGPCGADEGWTLLDQLRAARNAVATAPVAADDTASPAVGMDEGVESEAAEESSLPPVRHAAGKSIPLSTQALPPPNKLRLIEARPLPLGEASQSAAAKRENSATAESALELAPIVDSRTARMLRSAATSSENLPPILPASALPKPSQRTQAPPGGAKPDKLADAPAAASPAEESPTAKPLPIDLGAVPKEGPPRNALPKLPVIQSPKPAFTPALPATQSGDSKSVGRVQPLPPGSRFANGGDAQAVVITNQHALRPAMPQLPRLAQPRAEPAPAVYPIANSLPPASANPLPPTTAEPRIATAAPQPQLQFNQFVQPRSSQAKPQNVRAETPAVETLTPAEKLSAKLAEVAPQERAEIPQQRPEPAELAPPLIAQQLPGLPEFAAQPAKLQPLPSFSPPEVATTESAPSSESVAATETTNEAPPAPLRLSLTAPAKSPDFARDDASRPAAIKPAAKPEKVANPRAAQDKKSEAPALTAAVALETEPASTPKSVELAPVVAARAVAARQAELASQMPMVQRPIRKSPVQPAEFTTAIGGSAFTRQPGDNEPAAAEAPDVEFGQLPEGSPFEAISQSGTIKLQVRRSLLMRTKVDIYRTAIVDDGVVELAQFTPREISLIGRSQGQTHVTFWFDDPNMQPVTYLVDVAIDAEAEKKDQDRYKLLETVVNEMFPDSKVYLALVADKLLVKGQARDAEEAAQIMTIIRAQAGGYGMGAAGYGGLTQGFATPVISQAAAGGPPGPSYTVINMLRVPGVQQVALRVKIAELNRTAARGFGVDVVGEIDIGSAAEGSKLFLASLLNASSAGGTALLAQVDGDDLNIGIRYLQQRGVVKLLSEPTLVTLSGRPATFVAGGEFAVPTVVGSVGLNAVTTDFRAFGAIISFLPTVVDKDRIRLQVAPEFSQINADLAVGGTPGLNVRSATTTVEMREGQTLAIAGLLEDSYKGTTIGNLPYLAQVFGRRDTTRSETELIILVTPELVQPLEPEEVPPLPGFDVTEPNACQFFYHGDIEGNPTRDHRSTVWPRLRKRYGMGGPAMTSGPFGHGQ
jgi:pilus assembly protein CpaC